MIKKGYIGLTYLLILLCLNIGDVYSIIFGSLHIILMLLWVTEYQIKRRRNIKSGQLSFVVLALTLYSIFVLIISVLSGQNVLKSAKTWYPFFVISTSIPIGNHFNNREKNQIIWALSLVSLFVSALSLLEIYRLSSLAELLNPSSSYIFLFGIPSALFLSLSSQEKYIKITSFSIYLILAFRTLVQDSSQPALTFLLATVFILALYYYEGNSLYGVMKGILIGFVLFASMVAMLATSPSIRGKLINELDTYQIVSALAYRISQYKYSFDKLVEAPFIGHGFGYDIKVMTLIDKAGLSSGSRVGTVENLHTLYGSSAVYGGSLLLILVILVIAKSLYISLKKVKKVSRYKTLSYYDLALVLAIVFVSLSFFSSKADQIEVWMSLSIAVALIISDKR